jgi:hypothetical protein
MTPLTAFVVMPFAPEYDEIYNLFIADALTEAGFQVQRADDLIHQRNILEDIVASIATADLIVADLTGSNANVYYEVGIAHGMGRRVVLLTQAVDDLPFDLRSNRVIPYNTHFSAIKNARNALLEVARGAASGTLQFGSPVSDYGGASRLAREAPVPEEEGELGLVDHLIELEDGFGELAEFVQRITDRTTEVTQQTNVFSEKLTILSQGSESGRMKAARSLMRGYAIALIDFGKGVDAATRAYDTKLEGIEASLTYVVNVQSVNTSEDLASLRNFLTVLEGVEKQADSGRAAYASLADTMSGLPVMEKILDGARKTAISRVRRFVQSIDATIEVIAHARALGERILRRAEGPS